MRSPPIRTLVTSPTEQAVESMRRTAFRSVLSSVNGQDTGEPCDAHHETHVDELDTTIRSGTGIRESTGNGAQCSHVPGWTLGRLRCTNHRIIKMDRITHEERSIESDPRLCATERNRPTSSRKRQPLLRTPGEPPRRDQGPYMRERLRMHARAPMNAGSDAMSRHNAVAASVEPHRHPHILQIRACDQV